MFDLEKWSEIFDVVKANKLRTFLTAFSVSWGIFMLVLLLGAGKGLRNGFSNQFRRSAVNSVWLNTGSTSLPYKGMKPNRKIQLTNGEYDMITKSLSYIDYSSARVQNRSAKMYYKNKTTAFPYRGVAPGYQNVVGTVMDKGRYINALDIKEKAKVAILGQDVVKELFGDADPIGEYFMLSNIPVKVIGTFIDLNSRWEKRMVYMPITTVQHIFGGNENIDRIAFTTGNASFKQVDHMIAQLTELLSTTLIFDPTDTRALNIRNNAEDYKMFMGIFSGITVFIWIIGIMTIIAGAVGIGNIMMITVKERTKEIGVRKALGATPYDVVSMILLEAIVITTFAGYSGLVMGVFSLNYISGLATDPNTFLNPGVDLNVAALSTIVLVLAGSIAGLIPAIRAGSVPPIVALRDE